MYDTYEDHDDTPWWRRAWVIAAAVGLVAVIVAGVVLWPNDSTPANGGNGPSGNESPAAESSSTCGLPDGDQSVPTTPPADAEWVLVEGFATPRSDELGPGEESDGIHSCFAHNPAGAVLASMNLYADSFDEGVTGVALMEKRAARGGGYDDAIEYYESESGSDSGDLDYGQQFAGFRVSAYAPERATVETVLLASSGDLAGQLVATTDTFVWQDGDWYLEIEEGAEPQTSRLSSLAGYIEWSGTGSSSNDGVAPRAAPRWGLRASSDEIVTPSADPAEKCGRLEKLCDTAQDVVNNTPAGIVAGQVGDAASDAASSVASGVLDDLARQASEAADWALTTLLTAWMQLPDPDVTSPDSVTVWLTTQMEWLIAAAMIASIFVAGYRLAITGKFDHARELLDALIRVTIVSGLVGAGTTLAMQIGDEFSAWVFTQVDLELNLVEVLGGLRFAWVILSFGLFVLLVQIIQLGLMFIRAAMVPLLVFGLTLSAAGSNTSMGRQAFQKQLSWLIAFILFKPTAALIYAVAIKMISTTDDIPTVLGGLILMLLGVLALPGLMRLIVPATAGMSGGNAGALAGATVGAALATGAVVATGGAAAAGGGLAGSFGSGASMAGPGSAPIAGAAPTGGGLGGGMSGGTGGAMPGAGGAGTPSGSGGGAMPGAGGGAGGGSAGGSGGPTVGEGSLGLEGARDVPDATGSGGGGSASGVDLGKVLNAASQAGRSGSEDGASAAGLPAEGADSNSGEDQA